MWAPTHPRWRGAGWQKNCRPAGILTALLLACTGLVDVAQGVYIKAKAIMAQVLLEQAWIRTLDQEAPQKPWASADFTPVLKLSVPRLGQDDIVLSGVSGQAMAFGPGMMQGPKPGEPGLSVLAAHRDTHFNFLKKIRIGDIIEITQSDRRIYRFRITGTSIVQASNSGLYSDGLKREIALVTCWPFAATTRGQQRFVARGELMSEI